jgi:stage III sporulation protein AG
LSKLLEYLGFSGQNESKFPSKEQGRRGIWLIVLAALGVTILIFSGVISSVQGTGQPTGQTPQQESNVTAVPDQASSGMTAEEEQLGRKLCEMLRQVEGAGRVEVSVRLSGTTRAEYAVNNTTGKKITQEKDQSGGTRTSTEDTDSGVLVMNRSGNGSEQPVVERETAPQIAGVLVVADGASNAKVKAKLYEATRVAVGVEPQKILVLPMERR